MYAVELIDIVKRFGDVVAVDHVNLKVRDGEFFSLLGPSGCGKTTTLRMIAGLETPDEGIVKLHGQDVTYTPPHKRGIGMVFQTLALFPHMNVFENIAFGLRMRGYPEDEIRVVRGRGLRWPGPWLSSLRSSFSTSLWGPWILRLGRR